MRIVITTIDDPLVTNEFFRQILQVRKNDIVGIFVSKKTGQFTTKRKKNNFEYMISLIFINGLFTSIESFIKVLRYHFWNKKYGKESNPLSIFYYAKEYNIKIYDVDDLSNDNTFKLIRQFHPDIIINQTQEILNKEFIELASIGVINRHNSLLPKNRGRLAPFWALYNNEEYTGVTIHFVDRGIDTGSIIIQEKISISPKESYSSLTKRCYAIAPHLLIHALDIIEKGKYIPLISEESSETINSSPTIQHAIKYAMKRICRLL